MKKINIVYLPYRRFNFSDLTFKLFTKCKNQDFHITICGMNHQRGECNDLKIKANNLGLSADTLIVTSAEMNYLDKLKTASNMDFEFSFKLDEDIFINPNVWDYMFDNLHLLNDEKNLLISTSLSNGIPSCDWFIKHHFSDKEKQEINSLFSKTRIPSIWGADYSRLNNWKVTGYNANGWYEQVSYINHYYKGIHPVRVDLASQDYINNWIINHKDLLYTKKELFLTEATQPYFCNSIFGIKTSLWKTILEDKSLYRDNFDEVTLNLYRHQSGKKMLFVENGFGVHTIYNTLFSDINNPKELIDKKEEQLFESLNS